MKARLIPRLGAMAIRIVGALLIALGASMLARGTGGWTVWAWIVVLAIGFVASAVDVHDALAAEMSPPQITVQAPPIDAEVSDAIAEILACSHAQNEGLQRLADSVVGLMDVLSSSPSPPTDVVSAAPPAIDLSPVLPPPFTEPEAEPDPSVIADVVLALEALGYKKQTRALAEEAIASAPAGSSAQDVIREWFARKSRAPK